MNRAVIVAALAAGGIAYADEPVPPAPAPPEAPAETSEVDAHIAKARELHDKGDFEGARAEILAAYKLEPRPELLFALGQLEFNLHHYREAIDYYERFTATQPSAEQAALAEQAIGAARAELSRPPPKLPPAPKLPPPLHTRWDAVDSGLAAVGGLALVAGGGLAYDAVRISRDTSGALSAYDHRIATAHHLQLAAALSGGAGVVALGAAILRWRLHVVADVEVVASPSGAAVSWGRTF